MIERNQVIRGITSYLDAELMPKMHMESWKQFAVATAISISVKRMDRLIDVARDNKIVSALGLIDDEGNMDIDLIIEQAKSNIPPQGLTVPVPALGEIVLHPSDLDTLYRSIMGG